MINSNSGIKMTHSFYDDPAEAEGEVRDDRDCCQRYDPRKNPEEFIILLAAIMILVGITIMTVGYVVPRGYMFDPSLPAREMEKIGRQFAELSYSLDVCIVTGMTLIAFASIVITAVCVRYVICWRERIYREAERDDLTLLPVVDLQVTTYGSRVRD